MANPVFPVLDESVAEALSDTVDAATGVKHQDFGADPDSTPSAFSQLMNTEHGLMDLLGGANQGRVISLDDGLTVGAYALIYSIGATTYTFAGSASTTLTASSTCYIYLDADETLKHLTTGWPEGDHVKLAIATTDETTVTAVADYRWTNFLVGAMTNWYDYPAQGPVDLNLQRLIGIGDFGFGATSILTLDVDGKISPSRLPNSVDTYAGAASDDLVTIDAPIGLTGRWLLISGYNAARVVTIRDGVDNIILLDGDFVLDGETKTMLLRQIGISWLEVCRNRNTLAILTALLDADGNAITNVGRLNFTSTELTIADGEVTITGSEHTIDTENDAAADDLDTINGGADGDILILSGANAARVTTIKHGTGNIATATAGVYALSAGLSRSIILQRRVGVWLERGRSHWTIADLAETGYGIATPMTAFLAGALAVQTYPNEIYCFNAQVMHNARLELGTAPSGGACIIDILDNGDSIFSIQAEMLNCADGVSADTSATKDHVFAAGHTIAFQVEAANGAANATITMNNFAEPQTPPV